VQLEQNVYFFKFGVTWIWGDSCFMKGNKYFGPNLFCMVSIIVMCPGQKFFWPRSGRVRHLWIGFLFGKFPKKCQIFQFFSLRVKKISSGRNKKYPCQGQVGLLFTAGQKYARVGSGPIYRLSNLLMGQG